MMKVEETFKLSTKRFCMFYEFERMWLLLTAINAVAVFLIIRGSTAPLLLDNAVLRILFCSDINADKTLYNIAISYFAAYIFYLIQIYYPEREKTLNALLNIRSSARNMIMWVYRFLFIWDTYMQEADDAKEKIKGAEIKTVYLKDTTGFVYKVDRDDFEDMVKRISELYNDIINDAAFHSSDYSLRRLFLSKNIARYIESMYERIVEAEVLNASGSILIGYSKTEIDSLKCKMQYLEKLLDINVSKEYIITNDKEDIEMIEKRDQKLAEVLLQNSEFCKVLSQRKSR